MLVLGHTITFASAVINIAFELPDIPDEEGNALLSSQDKEFLVAVLAAKARPSAHWEGRDTARVLKAQLLDFEATAWMN